MAKAKTLKVQLERHGENDSNLIFRRVLTPKASGQSSPLEFRPGDRPKHQYAIPGFLNSNLNLLLFGGKGGVGKTTCATAASLHLAENDPEKHFLLVSADPAHSVSDSLAGSSPPGNLKVLELEVKEYLADFWVKHKEKLHQIAARGTFLDDQDINQFLNLSLPGMDELVAFLEISKWVEEQRYNCIVVDTAPTGHTLRLLEMPGLMKKWLRVLDVLLAKHRYLKKVFSGSYQPDELDIFLEELNISVDRLERLLQDAGRCRFVPVMLAETLSVSETARLVGELEHLKIPVTDIVVNRLYQESLCPVCSDSYIQQMNELNKLINHSRLSGYVFWGIPLYPMEICGPKPLGAFLRDITKISEASSAITEIPKIPASHPLKVESAADLSLPKTMLLFAGKGGVGKTTLAAASALRLAHDLNDCKILIFSTDPAHSLSDCLGVPVGHKPTRICSGLTAMEIDAQAEFDSLKRQYSQELEKFLNALLPNLDLTFDREVMERILDLSPPGIDEIMALTSVMELLEGHKYDIVILDSAPTGHLLRLLELPEIFDQWLKTFFGLFLKYKQVFQLPKVSQHLVETSKNLKRLRALMGDPARCALYAVTILTEMAFQETHDLVSACRRMGINVPVLFLNLATPDNDCAFCAALYRRESHIKDKFQQLFPNIHQPLIYRHSNLQGLKQLEDLGQALYQPVMQELYA